MNTLLPLIFLSLTSHAAEPEFGADSVVHSPVLGPYALPPQRPFFHMPPIPDDQELKYKTLNDRPAWALLAGLGAAAVAAWAGGRVLKMNTRIEEATTQQERETAIRKKNISIYTGCAALGFSGGFFIIHATL